MIWLGVILIVFLLAVWALAWHPEWYTPPERQRMREVSKRPFSDIQPLTYPMWQEGMVSTSEFYDYLQRSIYRNMGIK